MPSYLALSRPVLSRPARSRLPSVNRTGGVARGVSRGFERRVAPRVLLTVEQRTAASKESKEGEEKKKRKESKQRNKHPPNAPAPSTPYP